MFDDVEERRRLVYGFGELDGMAKHMDSLSTTLRALAEAIKTKSVSARDSLSATLEVRFTSGALAPERQVRWSHQVVLGLYSGPHYGPDGSSP